MSQREMSLIKRLKELFVLVVELPVSEREELSPVSYALETNEPVNLSSLKDLSPSPLYSDITDILYELDEINTLWLINASKDQELFNILSRIRQGCGN